MPYTGNSSASDTTNSNIAHIGNSNRHKVLKFKLITERKDGKSKIDGQKLLKIQIWFAKTIAN